MWGVIKREICTVGASLSEQPLSHKDVIIVWSAHREEFINMLPGTLGELKVCEWDMSLPVPGSRTQLEKTELVWWGFAP